MVIYVHVRDTVCIYKNIRKKTTELKNITVSFILFCDPLPLGDVAAQPSLQPPQMKVRHTHALFIAAYWGTQSLM